MTQHLPENGRSPENAPATKTSRQPLGIRRLTLTAGVLLAGFALSSCAQPVDHAGSQVDGTQVDGSQVDGSQVDGAQLRATPQPSENSSARAGAAAPQPRDGGTGRDEARPSGSQRAEPESPRPDRCHTSQLDGSLTSTDHGAGQRYADLSLRNHSGETCVIYGYGGLELTGAHGQPLPTDLQRTSEPGPEMVRLAPGDAATTSLRWSVVPHGDEPVDGPCQPTPATARVTPPDETDSLPVTWNLGFVCGAGSIEGSAYH